MVSRNPDTGNIVVAARAGALGYFLAPAVGRVLFWPRNDSAPIDVARYTKSVLAGRTFAVACAGSACALVATYPMGNLLLGTALLAYGAALTRYPAAWLVAVPALLPVLDLAPWSGRFFIDEFDGVVLVTLAGR